MRSLLRLILTFCVAAIGLMAFRSLAFAIYTVEGDRLEPTLKRGDRILVNRWSYGLRAGSKDGMFGYGRICRSPVRRGDLVAFDNPADSTRGMFVCRCKALPGDTIRVGGQPYIIPGLINCAPENCYWLEAIGKGAGPDSKTLGPVAESYIIGRVEMVVYNHDDNLTIVEGYDDLRFFRLLDK